MMMKKMIMKQITKNKNRVSNIVVMSIDSGHV